MESPVSYSIQITPRARKDIRGLDRKTRRRINEAILSLAQNPRPLGVRKLKGAEGLWRIRVGPYRVIYEIRDNKIVVIIVRVRHRRDAYR